MENMKNGSAEVGTGVTVGFQQVASVKLSALIIFTRVKFIFTRVTLIFTRVKLIFRLASVASYSIHFCCV
jgi:hypothetical protein